MNSPLPDSSKCRFSHLRSAAAVAVTLALAATASVADYEAGQSAYDRWDMATAEATLQKSAQTDPRAAKLLAALYAGGHAGDATKRASLRTEALEHAASLGDAQGKLLLAMDLLSRAASATPADPEAVKRAMALAGDACEAGTPRACRLALGILVGDRNVAEFQRIPNVPPNPEEARRLARLWHQHVAKEESKSRLVSSLMWLYPHVGKDWSPIGPAIGLAYHALTSEYLEGSPRSFLDSPGLASPYASAGAEDRRAAIAKGRALAREFGLFGVDKRTPAEMARAVARLLGVDETQRGFADDQGRSNLAIIFAFPSEVLAARGLRLPDDASAAIDLTRTHLQRVQPVRISHGVDATTFYATSLAKELTPVELELLVTFLESPSGTRFLAFRHALREVMSTSALECVRISLDPALGGVKVSIERRLEEASRKRELESSPSVLPAEAMRVRFAASQSDILAKSLQVFGPTHIARSCVSLAAPRLNEIAKLVTPTDIGTIAGFQVSSAWRKLEPLERSLSSARRAVRELAEADQSYFGQLHELFEKK